MGNDQSFLKGLEIDKKPIETTDYWSIYSGELKKENSLTTSITIFQGEQVVTGQLWANKSPLQRATRNFMIYRHPSILRFITSFEKGSVLYLATERCKPLTSILSTQNDTQICLGLRNILCALTFLIEKANMCHLNICTSSIYVTTNGAWRIGGFEHLWPKAEVTQTLLERSQPYRYKDAIDKNESKTNDLYGIEQYAFGILCEEILCNRKESLSIPFVSEFRNYCIEHLRNANPNNRPKLSAILSHPYFNQDFITIHSFLTELPLKSQLEKQTFFTSLIECLRQFDEIVVANELIELILSRMVLLNETAKMYVIPFILQPNDDTDQAPTSITPLFSPETFTKFVTPKIQQLFLVRDIQIRLVLLEYFPAFINYFANKETISDHILPQLLLGIKDTNDELVAATLRCLADLVPILGSSVVIGRNRGKIFADGKPNGRIEKNEENTTKWSEARSITPVMNGLSTDFVSSSPLPTESASIASIINLQNTNAMPERLSPDGGEAEQTNIHDPSDFADDGWDDWETETNEQQQIHVTEDSDTNQIIEENDENTAINASLSTSSFQRSISISSSNSNANDSFIKDIKEIEIKIINTQLDDEIDDFFKDMEPVIATSNSTLALLATEMKTKDSDISSAKSLEIDKSRFAVKTEIDNGDDDINTDAWGNDDWDD